MKRDSIREILTKPEAYLDRQATVCGWVRTVRDMKSFVFVEVSDGSYQKNIQLVVASGSGCHETALKLGVGAAICVTGPVKPSPAPGQPVEIHVLSLSVEGEAPSDYPLQKKRHTMEYLRQIAHLRPRTNTLGAVFRLRSAVAFAIHAFFHERGFMYVNTPIITPSDCEGAGEMFRVTTLDPESAPKDGSKPGPADDFFGKRAHLTVSGQLEAEAFALAFGKVYTFGPTFRAENSNTARHAAEFWMIEPEIAFADLADNMELAEDMVRHVVAFALENCPEEIAFFDRFVEKGLADRLMAVRDAGPFVRLSYTEAIRLLEEKKGQFKYPVFWGCDLQTEHERYITEQVMRRPTFVTDYPKEIKSFYMRLNDDGKTVAAMDLLVPGVGELIGGSQREERLNILTARMKECGLDPEEYWWYLDLRRYGGARHAGFGLGFERLVMYLTGISNIRDVIPFPRTVGSAEF